MLPCPLLQAGGSSHPGSPHPAQRASSPNQMKLARKGEWL